LLVSVASVLIAGTSFLTVLSIVRTSGSSNCPAEQGAEGELAFGYGPERPRALLTARFAMASADGTAVARTHDRGRNWWRVFARKGSSLFRRRAPALITRPTQGSADRSRDGLARITNEGVILAATVHVRTIRDQIARKNRVTVCPASRADLSRRG